MSENQVILTFDDGPLGDDGRKAECLRLILNTLKQHGAIGIFYVLGNEVKQYPELARLIVNEGHIIQNHSWNHERLPDLSEKELRTNLQNTQDTIYRITGRRPSRLRPPYGAGLKAELVNRVANQLGLDVTGWDIDTRDARSGAIANPHLRLELCDPPWMDWKSTYNRRRKPLDILMHVKKTTGLALGIFMGKLKGAGWRFTTYGDEHLPLQAAYYIQIFAGSQPGANQKKIDANTLGYRDIQIVLQGGIHKVHVGPYNSRKDADKALEALKTRFVGAFVVEKKP
jgi:peptidoglycan-N-acetylglucosamine deacetylase